MPTKTSLFARQREPEIVGGAGARSPRYYCQQQDLDRGRYADDHGDGDAVGGEIHQPREVEPVPPGERSQRHRLPAQQRDQSEAERGPASPSSPPDRGRQRHHRQRRTTENMIALCALLNASPPDETEGSLGIPSRRRASRAARMATRRIRVGTDFCSFGIASSPKAPATKARPPASPPPAGTQIWPTMGYTIGRHSPVRIGCRIRIVSCCWIVGRSINIRYAWTTQHQFPTTRIPRGKRLADRKRPRIGLCAGRRSAR